MAQRADMVGSLAGLGVTEAPLALDLLIILALAAVVAQLFSRLKLATIPGFLVAGFLAGPVFKLVTEPERIEQMSSLATILLMFTIGLHLDVNMIRRGMVSILAVGAISTVAFTLLAWPIGLAFGSSAPASLLIAMALSMSSTAVVLRILQDRRELPRLHGRMCFGIAIVQDLAAVVFLALIPPIASWAGTEMSGAVGEAQQQSSSLPKLVQLVASGAVGIGGVTVLILLGRYLLPSVLREAARGSSAELVLIVAAAVALGSAIASHRLGFSTEMGAFLAGFLIASTPFKHHLSGQLSPLRDLLMAVFFTVIGLKIQTGAVLDGWVEVLLGLIVLLIVKAATIGFSAWALGSSASAAVLTGIYLAQGGEFSLVVLDQGNRANVISDEVQARVIAVVVLSLIIAPLLVPLAHRLAQNAAGVRPAPWLRGVRFARSLQERASSPSSGLDSAAQSADGLTPTDGTVAPDADERPPEEPERGHVIIAGYGPVGRTLAEKFVKARVPMVIIELNPKTVQRQSVLGRRIVYGDVTNAEVLESAGLREADAILLTIPDEDASLRACPVIRALNPSVFIGARANYLSRAIALQEAGADHVIVEEMATAEAMGREVLARVMRRRDRAGGGIPVRTEGDQADDAPR
ncbi:MAG: cation:proton antiporter [Planctomycetota bacterium]|nr:cation:proton antiporter [Planctomycetota bacterium]